MTFRKVQWKHTSVRSKTVTVKQQGSFEQVATTRKSGNIIKSAYSQKCCSPTDRNDRVVTVYCCRRIEFRKRYQIQTYNAVFSFRNPDFQSSATIWFPFTGPQIKNTTYNTCQIHRNLHINVLGRKHDNGITNAASSQHIASIRKAKLSPSVCKPGMRVDLL